MRRLWLGVCCGVAAVVWGAAISALGAARADLALEIKADRQEYLMDEPFYVIVRLRNTGAQ